MLKREREASEEAAATTESDPLTTLLRQVCEVAPDWMHLSYHEVKTADGELPGEAYIESRLCSFCGEYQEQSVVQGSHHQLKDDFVDGRLIVAMLDAIERAGWQWEMWTTSGNQAPFYGVRCIKPGDTRLMVSKQMANTRAEAIARSFVEVFKS